MKFRFKIYVWGLGKYHGQLGLGDKSNRHEPTLLNTCNEWTQIVGGGYHTVALTKEGNVFTWGNNEYGQLGHGDREDKHIPTKVESLDGLFIVKIACGGDHTIAITDEGNTYT